MCSPNPVEEDDNQQDKDGVTFFHASIKSHQKIKNGRTQAGGFFLFILILFLKLVKKLQFYLII